VACHQSGDLGRSMLLTIPHHIFMRAGAVAKVGDGASERVQVVIDRVGTRACDDDCVRATSGRLLDIAVGELCHDAREQFRRVAPVNEPAKVARTERACKPTQGRLGHQGGDVLMQFLRLLSGSTGSKNTLH
jgi:hypothetical protein